MVDHSAITACWLTYGIDYITYLLHEAESLAT
jgi:hypothetical protein